MVNPFSPPFFPPSHCAGTLCSCTDTRIASKQANPHKIWPRSRKREILRYPNLTFLFCPSAAFQFHPPLLTTVRTIGLRMRPWTEWRGNEIMTDMWINKYCTVRNNALISRIICTYCVSRLETTSWIILNCKKILLSYMKDWENWKKNMGKTRVDCFAALDWSIRLEWCLVVVVVSTHPFLHFIITSCYYSCVGSLTLPKGIMLNILYVNTNKATSCGNDILTKFCGGCFVKKWFLSSFARPIRTVLNIRRLKNLASSCHFPPTLHFLQFGLTRFPLKGKKRCVERSFQKHFSSKKHHLKT